jgi:hypothetical protein
MPKKLQLHIADPCHEDWDTMTTADKGRFCGSCQKKVIDFSDMSDREIAQFFKRPSAGSVCGRFMADQLERDIKIEKKRLPWIKYFFQILLPAFLLGNEVQAQKGKAKKKTSVVSPRSDVMRWGMVGPAYKPNTIPVEKTKVSLTVFVKAATTNEPVPYASVNIAKWKAKAIANNDGETELLLEDATGTAEVKISCVGYKTKTVSVSLSSALVVKGLQVELEIDPIVMEEIVVVGNVEYKPSGNATGNSPVAYYVNGCVTSSYNNTIPKEALLTTIKNFIPPKPPDVVLRCSVPGITVIGDTIIREQAAAKAITIEKKDPAVAATIYPNPVNRGETITIDFKSKTSETIMVKLIAADGKTLIIHRQPISTGNNRFTITTDPAWTAGIYFLVFSNEKGILIKTEEVLIQ